MCYWSWNSSQILKKKRGTHKLGISLILMYKYIKMLGIALQLWAVPWGWNARSDSIQMGALKELVSWGCTSRVAESPRKTLSHSTRNLQGQVPKLRMHSLITATITSCGAQIVLRWLCRRWLEWSETRRRLQEISMWKGLHLSPLQKNWEDSVKSQSGVSYSNNASVHDRVDKAFHNTLQTKPGLEGGGTTATEKSL